MARRDFRGSVSGVTGLIGRLIRRNVLEVMFLANTLGALGTQGKLGRVGGFFFYPFAVHNESLFFHSFILFSFYIMVYLNR